MKQLERINLNWLGLRSVAFWVVAQRKASGLRMEKTGPSETLVDDENHIKSTTIIKVLKSKLKLNISSQRLVQTQKHKTDRLTPDSSEQ
jgi:hypothetical protein